MLRRPPSRGRLLLLEIRNVVLTTVLGLLLIAAAFGAVIVIVRTVTG